MKQDFYRPEFKQWKDENPQLWKAAQLLWITLVIGTRFVQLVLVVSRSPCVNL